MVNLSIIVLSYNTKNLTLKCIESLVNQYRRELKKGDFEIIVVDNASTDGSPSVISNLSPRASGDARRGEAGKSQISNLRIILNKKNLGFAKGCNIGAAKVKGKYILFLNSDTVIEDDGFLRMVDFLEKNQYIGILGAVLRNPNGKEQLSSGKFYNLRILSGIEKIENIAVELNKESPVDWVSGGAMMVREKVFRTLGGFDEHFFMYMEDMELCYRAHRLGYQVYIYPNIKILHKGQGSSNRSFAIIHIYKGILYFYKKHKSYLEYLCVKLLLSVKAYVAILIGSLTNNKYLTITYKKALKF